MNIIQRFISWLTDFKFIRDIFIKEKIEPKKEKKPEVCNICNKKLGLIDKFECDYCGKFHCDKHRLPEEHDCKKATKPKGLNTGRISYSKGKTTYHTK